MSYGILIPTPLEKKKGESLCVSSKARVGWAVVLTRVEVPYNWADLRDLSSLHLRGAPRLPSATVYNFKSFLTLRYWLLDVSPSHSQTKYVVAKIGEDLDTTLQ